jgi:hypothetical protein
MTRMNSVWLSPLLYLITLHKHRNTKQCWFSRVWFLSDVNLWICTQLFSRTDITLSVFIKSGLRAYVQSTTTNKQTKKQTQWPESASELYRPRDRRLSAKLVPTFFRIEGATWSERQIPTAVLSVFLNGAANFFFHVAPQLYSRDWVDPVPDPLLHRKSSSARNRTRTSRSVARNSDH